MLAKAISYCAFIILEPQVELRYSPLRCTSFSLKSVAHLQQSNPVETSEPVVTEWLTQVNIRFKPYCPANLLNIFRRLAYYTLSELSAVHGTVLTFFFFSFLPHFLEMTHFNGTMKNCNGFSTPTKQPTSRQGVAISSREGSLLDKAVKRKDLRWPSLAQRIPEK